MDPNNTVLTQWTYITYSAVHYAHSYMWNTMYVVNVPLFRAYGVQYPSMPDQVAYILFLRYCSILDLFVILFVQVVKK